jgi:transcriptional regulator GlxA family with amidase domain
MAPAKHPGQVAVLAPAVASAFEVSVAAEVFGYDRSELHDPWYDMRLCAPEPPRIATETGFGYHTEWGYEDAAGADIVIVPSWHRLDATPPAHMLQTVRDAHDRGARLMSFCTGAFVLGHAGVLDGLEATTHWRYRELFAATFPDVDPHPDALYIDSGQVLTSAGTAAAIDLCLHVVRGDLGAEVANAVARRMVVPPHREGGQAQFVEAPVASCPDSDPMRACLDWAVQHLDEPLSVEVMARRAALSPRTFARRFRDVTGETPMQWLLHQRVLLAQRLLETTDDSIEEIATQCGFGSATVLRDNFVRRTRTTPTGYRRAFQAEAV